MQRIIDEPTLAQLRITFNKMMIDDPVCGKSLDHALTRFQDLNNIDILNEIHK